MIEDVAIAKCPVAPVDCRAGINLIVDEYLAPLRPISKGLNHLGCRERPIKVVEENRKSVAFSEGVGRRAIDIHTNAMVWLFKGTEKLKVNPACPGRDIYFPSHGLFTVNRCMRLKFSRAIAVRSHGLSGTAGQAPLAKPVEDDSGHLIAVFVNHQGVAVAAYPKRRQFDPRDITAGRTEAVSPAFHGGPGVDPKRVLVEKITSHEQVGHTSQLRSILQARVRSAGRIQPS